MFNLRGAIKRTGIMKYILRQKITGSKKQKALEDFLNSPVEPKEVDLYLWQGIHYQILSMTVLKKKGLKHDHFIKYDFQGVTYYIREMSPELLKKYYMIKLDF
jgi:hypothetical protein